MANRKSNKFRIIMSLLAFVLSMMPAILANLKLINKGYDETKINYLLFPEYIYLLIIFVINIIFYITILRESAYVVIEKFKLIFFTFLIILVVTLFYSYFETKFESEEIIKEFIEKWNLSRYNLKYICFIFALVGIIGISNNYRKKPGF